MVAPLPLRTDRPTLLPPPSFASPRLLLEGTKGASSLIPRPVRVFLTDPGCAAFPAHSSLLLPPLLLALLLFSLSAVLPMI